MRVSVWRLRNYRYVKIAAAASLAAMVVFLLDAPAEGRNGGTWAGYLIGCAAAALTVWLGWYGIRKRRYGQGVVPLEEVLSAHISLGVAAMVLATLHTGFEFGFNFHLLSYAFLLVISVSGLCGVLLYAYVPAAMTANAGGRSLTDMMEEIAEINREARRIGAELDDDINRLIRRSVQYTVVGGTVWQLLTGRYTDRHTEVALEGIQSRAESFSALEAEAGRRLVTLLARKIEALGRFRRHIRYKAWMDIWLYVHVPLSFAYAAALIGHVAFVMYY